MITIGLYIYELNNDQNRARLFERGKRIEFELGIKEGVFIKSERDGTAKSGSGRMGSSKLISHGTALKIIYGTCILAWFIPLFVVLYHHM